MLEGLCLDHVAVFSRSLEELPEKTKKDISKRSETHFRSPSSYSESERVWLLSPDGILYMADKKKYNGNLLRIVYWIDHTGMPNHSRGNVRVFETLFIAEKDAQIITSKPMNERLDKWMHSVRENVHKKQIISMVGMPEFTYESVDYTPLNFTIKGRKKMTEKQLKDKKANDAMSMFRSAGLL